MKNTSKSISTNIGHIFAYLQSTIDSVVGKGFEKIEAYSESKQTQQAENQSLPKKVAFGVLGFIGNTGKAYYQKYSELRSKEKK